MERERSKTREAVACRKERKRRCSTPPSEGEDEETVAERKRQKSRQKRRRSSSNSSDSDSKKRKRKTLKKSKKRHKHHKKHKRKSSKPDKSKTSGSDDDTLIGPTPDVTSARSSMKPMTKEEWEKQQSVVRRVYDPETGRNRLIKGDGEVLEEIVSYKRHKEINKKATAEDGATFQATLGINRP